MATKLQTLREVLKFGNYSSLAEEKKERDEPFHDTYRDHGQQK
jgi:hypothetical protein